MDSTSIELHLLSEQLGLDTETEFKSFQWFLSMLLQIPLPSNWSKLFDTETNTIFYYYFDSDQNQTLISKIHPLINSFKGVLKEYLIKKSTLNDNNNNLSKIAAKITTLTKKSKVSRLNGPENGLLFPLYDEGPGKQRFLALKQALTKKIEEKQDFRLCKLDESEDLLEKYRLFYLEKYGDDILDLAKNVLNWPGYLRVDLEDLIENMEIFNIKHEEDYLYFIARLYSGLELPEDWLVSYLPIVSIENIRKKETEINETKDYIEKERVFVWRSQGIFTIIHPGFRYIKLLIGKAKLLAEKERNFLSKMAEQMVFKDKINQVFTLNVKELLLNKQDESFEENPDNSSEKINYSDDYILEIARQIGLDPKKDLHLFNIIHEFLMVKVKTQNDWTHKRLSNRQIYWINHSQKKAMNIYPYLSELKPIIESFRKEIGLEYGKYIIEHQEKENENYEDIIRFFKLKKIHDIILISRKEANGFIREYIEKGINAKSEFKYSASYLKKYLKNTKNISNDEIHSILFHNPFNLGNNNSEFSHYPIKEDSDGLAIKFIDNTMPSSIEKPPASNFLERLDDLDDFEDNDQENPDNMMSMSQIERQSDLMNNVILVIIERKYMHLAESLRKQLVETVEEDIRLILPYLINILEGKNEIKRENPIEDEKEEGDFLNTLKEIFEDSERKDEASIEYHRKLLMTLDYKYFDVGLNEMFNDYHSINLGLIRKMNRFIFHKYREIILREFINDEDLDKLDISEDVVEKEDSSESQISRAQSANLEILNKDPPLIETFETSIEKQEDPSLINPPQLLITSAKSLEIIKDPLITRKEIPEKSIKIPKEPIKTPTPINKKPKKPTYINWEGEKRLGKNHFMKQIVRMTMEEKKTRRRFADLMRRNPTSVNRLKKDFNDYTLSELKEAVSNLELLELEAKKERERVKKAKIKAKIQERKLKEKMKKNKEIDKKITQDKKNLEFKKEKVKKEKFLKEEVKKKIEIIRDQKKKKSLKILKKLVRRNSVSIDSEVSERIKKKSLKIQFKRTSIQEIEKTKNVNITSMKDILEAVDSYRELLYKKEKKSFNLPMILKKVNSESLEDFGSSLKFRRPKEKKETTIIKLPNLPKKHTFLKRKQNNLKNPLRKSSSLSPFSNESIKDLKTDEKGAENQPKKVPIAFKFASKEQFSDFYNYSEKNAKSSEPISLGSLINGNLKGISIKFERISRSNEGKGNEKEKIVFARKIIKKNNELPWVDIRERLEKREIKRKDRDGEDILKEIKENQEKETIPGKYKEKLEDNIDLLEKNVRVLKKITMNQRKDLENKKTTNLETIKVLKSFFKEKKPFVDAKTLRKKPKPHFEPLNRRITSEKTFKTDISLGIMDKSRVLSPITEEKRSSKKGFFYNIKKKLNLLSKFHEKNDFSDEIYYPIDVRGFKTLETLSHALIDESTSLVKEKVGVSSLFRDNLKSQKKGNLVKGKIMRNEKKKLEFYKKFEMNFEIKGNKLGNQIKIASLKGEIEGKQKKATIMRKRVDLRKKTKSFCGTQEYFKQYEMEEIWKGWFFRKSV